MGFLGNYDGGSGFIDFLADTGIFAAGTTVGGFSFESLSGPTANFTTFGALSEFGDEFSGLINVRINAVPDTGGTWLMAGLAFLALVFTRRSFSTRSNSQPQAQT